MGGKLNTPIGSFFEKKSDSFLEKLHKLEKLTVVKCFTKIFRSLPFQMSMVQNTTIFIKKDSVVGFKIFQTSYKY